MKISRSDETIEIILTYEEGQFHTMLGVFLTLMGRLEDVRRTKSGSPNHDSFSGKIGRDFARWLHGRLTKEDVKALYDLRSDLVHGTVNVSGAKLHIRNDKKRRSYSLSVEEFGEKLKAILLINPDYGNSLRYVSEINNPEPVSIVID